MIPHKGYREGVVMNMFRGFSAVCALCAAASCGQLQLGGGATVTNSAVVGMTWSGNDEYTKPVEFNSADFMPAGGSMEVSTNRGTPVEIGGNLDIRVRFWNLSVGALSNYSSLFWDLSDQDGGLSINDQKIRYAQLAWWDTVTMEEVMLTRSPSIGPTLGYWFSDPAKKWPDLVVQYSITFQHYRLRLNRFEGYDCVNCQNISAIKGTDAISSGLAIRHSLDIGYDCFRVRMWLERDGGTQMTYGLALVFWGKE